MILPKASTYLNQTLSVLAISHKLLCCFSLCSFLRRNDINQADKSVADSPLSHRFIRLFPVSPPGCLVVTFHNLFSSRHCLDMGIHTFLGCLVMGDNEAKGVWGIIHTFLGCLVREVQQITYKKSLKRNMKEKKQHYKV